MSSEESIPEIKPKKGLNIEKKTAITILGSVAGALLLAGGVAMLLPQPQLSTGKGHGKGREVASAHGDGHGDEHAEAVHNSDQSAVSGHGTHEKELGWFTKILLAYSAAIDSTQKKVTEMRNLHEDNILLRGENARLKHQVLTTKYEIQKKHSFDGAGAAAVQIEKQTGSKVGRVVASIAYEVPQNVPYAELLTLGVHYFKGHEDEKAAKIFVFLGEHGGEKFQTIDHAFLTAITLYRIDAFDDADKYFHAVLSGPNHVSIAPIKTQARLWRALIHDKKNHRFKSQFWLREMLDQDPRSEESAWVSGFKKPVLEPEVATMPPQHASAEHSAPAETHGDTQSEAHGH